MKPLLGFSIDEHARNTDLLRAGSASARLFIAASMLSDAARKYELARLHTADTGRRQSDAVAAALNVEATLIATARIAADALLTEKRVLYGIQRMATYLADQVDVVRRNRAKGEVTRTMRISAAVADAVHLWLTRGILRDVASAYYRDPARLPDRLVVRDCAMAEAVDAKIEKVAAVDTQELYVWLMSRRLEVALDRHRWLAAPHPVFRLNYGYVGGHALFGETERLGAVAAAMDERERAGSGYIFDNVTLKPVLDTSAAMQAAFASQTRPGRYLDLGVYHRAVTTRFIDRRADWMATTVATYTHHAYALGSRFCDIAMAAGHEPTHRFIRNSELDKPSQGSRRQALVLFYGLDIENTVLLGLRHILHRVIGRGAGTDGGRQAFGRTVHHILLRTAPSIAARLEMWSFLKLDTATCKSIANRVSALEGRFDTRDHDRPAGIFFDYALWFNRNRDVAFWDRLQKGAKLYGAFGSTLVPIEREPVPGRRGRKATAPDAPPSPWQQVMAKAKTAFDAYHPLYLKSRPSVLTARIMARICEGYSSLASDPQFLTIFKG